MTRTTLTISTEGNLSDKKSTGEVLKCEEGNGRALVLHSRVRPQSLARRYPVEAEDAFRRWRRRGAAPADGTLIGTGSDYPGLFASMQNLTVRLGNLACGFFSRTH
jgi:hypothetical protein